MNKKLDLNFKKFFPHAVSVGCTPVLRVIYRRLIDNDCRSLFFPPYLRFSAFRSENYLNRKCSTCWKTMFRDSVCGRFDANKLRYHVLPTQRPIYASLPSASWNYHNSRALAGDDKLDRGWKCPAQSAAADGSASSRNRLNKNDIYLEA